MRFVGFCGLGFLLQFDDLNMLYRTLYVIDYMLYV